MNPCLNKELEAVEPRHSDDHRMGWFVGTQKIQVKDLDQKNISAVELEVSNMGFIFLKKLWTEQTKTTHTHTFKNGFKKHMFNSP